MNELKSPTKCTDALWKKYRTGFIPVIPDIKCKSPEHGILLPEQDSASYALSLEAAGAPVISVVTESAHYGGSPEMLSHIAKSVSVPVLRKDFITGCEMLKESADIGASGVLLIASMLEKRQLFQLVEDALALNLEPLVETHNKEEIMLANELNLTFLGINNRNIGIWETDNGNVNTTEQLASFVRRDALLLSESSISSPEDVQRAVKAGAHAVLVGTAVMRAVDPVRMYRMLGNVMV
ncbi:MAG: indole-3-glycerol-phosphate synthase [Bacillota bacterium]|nr:indole-3-glycerol-phosphate synthase [Bacillota bacterium]